MIILSFSPSQSVQTYNELEMLRFDDKLNSLVCCEASACLKELLVCQPAQGLLRLVLLLLLPLFVVVLFLALLERGALNELLAVQGSLLLLPCLLLGLLLRLNDNVTVLKK